MELKLLHFYPDLMSLYGSYANVAVLRRHLEELGNSVTVEPVHPGQDADIAGADFLFMAISARDFFLISLPAAANWATWPMLEALEACPPVLE